MTEYEEENGDLMFIDYKGEDWRERVNAVIENTAAGHHGIEIVEIEEDRIVAEMEITDKSRQPMGMLHGGVNMLIAETVASLHAGIGVDLSEKVPVGIEINGSHMRSVSEGRIRAEGRVIKRGRNMIWHQVDIYRMSDGKLISTVRMTNYYRRVG